MKTARIKDITSTLLSFCGKQREVDFKNGYRIDYGSMLAQIARHFINQSFLQDKVQFVNAAYYYTDDMDIVKIVPIRTNYQKHLEDLCHSFNIEHIDSNKTVYKGSLINHSYTYCP
ncbi:MAG: hypothetical protein ACPGXZ_00735 [Saprospiraceae bacterium]